MPVENGKLVVAGDLEMTFDSLPATVQKTIEFECFGCLLVLLCRGSELGSKQQKMVYADEHSAGKSVKIVPVDKAERNQFSLSNEELVELAKQALIIEKHYGHAMDIEWAKDGDSGKLFIVQARPETVKSRESQNVMERYILKEKGDVICEGRSIGQRIGAGGPRAPARRDHRGAAGPAARPRQPLAQEGGRGALATAYGRAWTRGAARTAKTCSSRAIRGRFTTRARTRR